MRKLSSFFIIAVFIAGCGNEKTTQPTPDHSLTKPLEPLAALPVSSCPLTEPALCPECEDLDIPGLNASLIYTEKDVYPKIVGLWSNHLSKYGISGKSWIGTAPGNGEVDHKHLHKKRHTAVFIPSNYDYEKNPDIVFWLHGHNGFNKFGIRIFRHLDSLFDNGQNPIVIAVEQPWSAWTTTRTSRNGTGPFRKVSDFNRWLDYMFDVLHELGIPPEKVLSRNITLIGHSAGGSGIMAMAKSGALSYLRPGKIIFSDSTYGRWFDVTYDKYISKFPDTKVYVLTQKYGRPWKSMKRFYSERSSVNKNVVHIPTKLTHKQIGDNCVLYPAGPFQ